MTVAVLIPVKAFHRAKARLAPALDAPARERLARSMAEHVVAAAAPLPVTIVCDDPGVAAWAAALHIPVVWAPGRGLDRAVEHGVAVLGENGAAAVIVAHADLPLAGALAWTAAFAGVTLVPDQRDDGTNVACVPTGAGFRFAYGPASFRRHGAEAIRLGLPLRVVREPLLGHDVDVPDDLVVCT